MEPNTPPAPPSYMGKLLIVGIMVIAFAMAGFGWWFRFQSTRQTAQFWGPEAAHLIRDASQIYAFRLSADDLVSDWQSQLDLQGENGGELPAGVLGVREAEKARGMTHLKTALLEDRSYQWDKAESDPGAAPVKVVFGLLFVDSELGDSKQGDTEQGIDSKQGNQIALGFSENCESMVRYSSNGEVVATLSTLPIAGGLQIVFSEIFADLDADPVVDSADSTR